MFEYAFQMQQIIIPVKIYGQMYLCWHWTTNTLTNEGPWHIQQICPNEFPNSIKIGWSSKSWQAGDVGWHGCGGLRLLGLHHYPPQQDQTVLTKHMGPLSPVGKTENGWCECLIKDVPLWRWPTQRNESDPLGLKGCVALCEGSEKNLISIWESERGKTAVASACDWVYYRG